MAVVAAGTPPGPSPTSELEPLTSGSPSRSANGRHSSRAAVADAAAAAPPSATPLPAATGLRKTTMYSCVRMKKSYRIDSDAPRAVPVQHRCRLIICHDAHAPPCVSPAHEATPPGTRKRKGSGSLRTLHSP